MNQRLHRLRTWWQQRETRERWMLGVMIACVVTFVFWYGVFGPLRSLRDAAELRHERAALALLQTDLQLAQLRALDARVPPMSMDAAALKEVVLDAARTAGLAVSREREDAGTGFGIEADAATPAQLFAWLDALRVEHGLAPSTLSVAKSEGRLRVQAGFDLPQ